MKPKFNIGDKVRPLIDPLAEGTIMGFALGSLNNDGEIDERVYKVKWKPIDLSDTIINFWLAKDLKLLYNGVERAVKRVQTTKI